MAIYRGIGGAGENNQDATITAVTQQATNAANSASAALASKNEAVASATAAYNYKVEAGTSEAFASAYSTNAANSALSAATSETDAQTAADTAYSSQLLAGGFANNAEASAIAAANSAASITGAETNSAASAAAALVSEGNAATSETNAAASAAAALVSEGNAATSETNAAASASAAASDAATIAATYDAFDDRYLGSKTSDPTVDNDGNALLTGALYYDSVSGVMKVYSGTNWVAAYASAGGALNAVNNLSDVDSAVTARSNLGLGSAAVEDVSAFVAPNSTTTLYSLTTTDGLEVGGALVVTGNLTVNGTTTTIDTTNLAVQDNMIYLNSGNAVTNPDLGIAGNYNDGSYAHAGFFRDATDGRWKAFDGYTPEPDASPEINTSHASFSLGDIQANTFYGALVGNASTATLAATATNVAYSGLTGTVPTWNQNTTGNAATADYATSAGTAAAVPYGNLTGTVPTWNQDTTGNAATATSATTASSATTAGSATQLSATTWTVSESGGVLYFAVSGVNKAKLDSSGNLTVVGNVTAYGSV